MWRDCKLLVTKPSWNAQVVSNCDSIYCRNMIKDNKEVVPLMGKKTNPSGNPPSNQQEKKPTESTPTKKR